MLTGILITGFVILLFVVTFKTGTGTKNKVTLLFEEPLQESERPLLIINEEAVANTVMADTMFDDVWWNKLTAIQQLQLALALCQKALPVWQKYTAGKEISYRNAAAGPVHKIGPTILDNAITSVLDVSQSQFPAANNKKINDCYSSFVDAVLALQDGVWLPAYPVKKIFLAVYSILKSIVEQHNNSGTAIILSAAINQALDCIDITKLHSREDVDCFLKLYKNKLQPLYAVV